jgi:hypothetical protein
MIISNADIEKKLIEKLGRVPTDKEIFNIFLRDLVISLGLAEQEAKIRKKGDFPEIIGESTFTDVEKKIKEYVLTNMAEYIQLHEININKIDFTKIVYWVGMYILEEHDNNYGIKFILGHIGREIYSDTGVRIDDMMIRKIIRVSSKGSDTFIKYYGRFGLYHSLKQIHKTLNSIPK